MKTMNEMYTIIRRNAFVYLTAILIAFGLKLHYSRAAAGDLVWILKPTASLVSIFTGGVFTFEAGAGYICPEMRVIIAPACAGVNFMLMAFGMAALAGLHHMRTQSHRIAWLLAGLTGAYGLTICVNTLRIVVSIHTFHSDMFSGSPTWEGVHRLEGIAIYFFFQYLFYSMIQNIIRLYRRRRLQREYAPWLENPGRTIRIRETAAAGLIPCAWYLAMTLAVPLLNGAHAKNGALFLHHAGMVFCFCLMIWILIVGFKLCGQSAALFLKRGRLKHEAENSDRRG